MRLRLVRWHQPAVLRGEAMATLTQKRLWNELKEDAVLWIDPATMDFATGTKHPATNALIMRFGIGSTRLRRLVRRIAQKVGNEPFVLPERLFGPRQLIVEMDKYKKVHDLILHRQQPRESFWYEGLVNQINDVGFARHKEYIMRDVEAVDLFFEHHVLELIQSLETVGYDVEKASDVGTAHIDANGALTKAGSGRHRFFAAKILGVDRFPLKIAGVHEHWFRKVGAAYGDGLEALKYGIKEVESRHQS
jgi:hypothetical protein